MVGPFTFIIIVVAITAAFYGIRAVLGYRQVWQDAEAEYSYKSSQGMIPEGISKDGYLKAYRRFYAPRGAAHVAGAMGGVLLLTYPAMILIQIILDRIWVATGRGDVIHPGYLVWQFLIFFGILGLWAGIIYLTARNFHRSAPISFKDEISRQMSQ